MTRPRHAYAHVDHHRELRVDDTREVGARRRKLLDRPVVQEHEVVHHLESHQRKAFPGDQLQHATQTHQLRHLLHAQGVHVCGRVTSVGGGSVEVHAQTSRVALAVLGWETCSEETLLSSSSFTTVSSFP